MKQRKILALLLALAMMFALAACGTTPETEESPVATTPEATEAPATDTPAEPISLTAWAWLTNVDALQEAATEYTQLTGIQIDLDIVDSGDAMTNLTTCLESGDRDSLPDILLIEDTNAAKYMLSYSDVFYDLTDYVDWSQVAEAKSALTSVGDVHYGVPFDSGASIAMYRTDLLEQAGYTIEDLTDITWDELFVIGADFYAKTGMYLLSDAGEMILQQIITSTGASIFNEDGSANVENNEAVTAALEIYKEAVDSKTLYLASDWNDYVASFNGGTVAAGVLNGCWIAMCVNAAADQAYLWDATNIPSVGSVTGSSHSTNYGGSSWFVLNNSENADAAAAFLAYMYAGEGMETYVDFMTNTMKYVTTYQPVVTSGYYDEIDDGFYPAGFWSTVADSAAAAPVFTPSVMYSSTFGNLAGAMQVVLEGGDLTAAISDAQAALDFEFAS